MVEYGCERCGGELLDDTYYSLKTYDAMGILNHFEPLCKGCLKELAEGG